VPSPRSAPTIRHVAPIASAEIRSMLREVAALPARDLAGEGIRVATALAADPSPPDARIEPATASMRAASETSAASTAVAGLAVLLASRVAANSAPVTGDVPPVDPSAVGAAVTRKRRVRDSGNARRRRPAGGRFFRRPLDAASDAVAHRAHAYGIA
jgi:hypothetical protein